MNFKKITLILILLTLIILILKILFNFELSPIKFIKSKMSWETKELINRNILVYKYINRLEKEINERDKIIDKKNKIISELSKNEIFTFYKEKVLGTNAIKVKYFKNPNFVNYGPRSYFAKNNKALYLVSGTTNTYFSQLEKFNSDFFIDKEIVFIKIPNNLDELLGEEYILDNETITKGVEIIENEIYVSLVKKNRDECHTNSIFKASLNNKFLKFKLFFDTKMCIPYFDNSSGGNISVYKNNRILMTIGDWVWVNEDLFPKNSQLNPQNKNDFLGKILSINLSDPNDVKIFAMGTRNSQGLFYDQTNDLVFFSDHGPQGGDEINVIKSEYSLPNYGWPIASYGHHYGYPENKMEKEYARAPLKKSHSKYGFIEPLKYFPDESPALSQIIKENKFENYNDDKIVLYQATLGDLNYGSKTIFKFVLDSNLKIIENENYLIDERVRDMIFLDEINKIIIYLETSGSIALLENN